ncbi:MAG: TonB-dependent receptor [Bryobacterales bacterium]|nr:TonB-dependent receptor [Bryobacterales bacterium]
MSRFLLLGLLATACAFAQGTVTIYGTVSDSTGAVVPGAQVTATQPSTGFTRAATSDAQGSYTMPQLNAGEYVVRVEAAGFKSFVLEKVQTQVDENRLVNVRLEVGQVSESISVTAEVAQVETRSGAIREVVDSERIVELPLNGRNPLELQYLVAGSGARTGKDQAQNGGVSINGSRPNSNNYQLDNGDNHDPYFNSPSIFPSPDALEEFSIQTNSYGADRGRNAGAFMSAVTKSGTNQFHGTVFEFLRNEKLNARNFFANTVPPFKRNQFGATFGGPVIKDKAFFFFSWQSTYERSAPGAVTTVVPTPAMRTGDFSALNRVIRDPLGGNFPNAVIPASRLSQTSSKFLEAFVPQPNRPGGLLATDSQQANNDHQFVIKGDYRLTNSNQLSARLLRNMNTFQEATGNLPGFFASIDYQNWSLAVTDTHIISPNMLNSFTFGFSDIDRRQLSVVPGNKGWNDFGAGFTRTMTADAPVGMHTVVDGYFNAFSRFPLNHLRKGFQFSEMVSWTKGAHLLKFGGDVRRSLLTMQEYFRGDPWVRFQNTHTGEAAADFMLGRMTQFEQIAEAYNKPRVFELGLFAQDDWKVSRRLTLNLGLRWDPWFPYTDELDKFAQVWPGVQSTVRPTAPLGLVFAGDGGTNRSMLNSQKDNLAPRFGFAFDPTGSGKSSIRGGYGIFYSQVRQQANNQISTNQPFSLKLTVQQAQGTVENPYVGVTNPFPFTAPTTPEQNAAYKYVLPMAVTEWNPNFRNAIAQQWNLSLQQQFAGSWVATAAYAGSKGNHLFMSSQMNPGVFGRTGNLDARRVLAPTFGSVTDQSSRGNSIYHSLQLSLNKRLTRGFTILANYTFSKLIDDASADGDAPSNPFNFRSERGPSDLDITHRFVGSYIWQLPKLTGSHFLLRQVLGGWENNGIVTFESGNWINFTSGFDASASGVNGDRPDLIGNPFLSASRSRADLVNAYFNTTAFTRNAAGTFGNVGRNIMRGPGMANVDFGLNKSFPVREQMRLQLRGEFFNAFNRVNLGNPNTNASSNQFGRITGAGSPRVIQLALKFMF